MGLLQKYKDWRKKKWLDKLKGGLEMLRNQINFDPRFLYTQIEDFETPEEFTKRIEEYRIWYIGNSRLLRKFYTQAVKNESLNYFWYSATDDVRMIHSGIPGLISAKMATVLFGSGVNVDVICYTQDGKIDESKSAAVQDLMNNLLDIANFAEKIANGAQQESWGGHVFFKLSHKVSLSNYPLLEVVDIRKAEIVKERGITTAIIFKYWYNYKNKNYRLDEIYTTNQDGDAIIRYELYKLNNDREEKVDLSEVPEVEQIRYTSDGEQRLNENDEFVYTGLKGMLAFEKPNKTPSHEFMSSIYGASDYEGALDSFDALDEAYSGLIAELRDNKTIRYIPENMLPRKIYQLSNGTQVIEVALPNKFITNYVAVKGDEDQNTKNEIKIQQIPDKTEENIIKYRTALTTAINQAGLSPFALGITGLESINSSAESQQERNKVTLETRALKLRLWKPFLEKLLEMMLQLNSWMQKNTSANQDAFAKVDLNFENLDVKVTFGDYIVDRVSDKINVWGGAKAQGVASTYMAVSRIHEGLLEDDEIIEEINRINFERGMSLDNPMNLPNLTGLEKNEEDELEEIEKQGELSEREDNNA